MISIILFPSLAILHLPCVGVEATLKKPLKKTLLLPIHDLYHFVSFSGYITLTMCGCRGNSEKALEENTAPPHP